MNNCKNLMQFKKYTLLQTYQVPLFCCLLVFVFWFGVKAGWNQIETDFPNYYVSSKMLLQDNLQDAYSIERFNTSIQEYVPTGSGMFVMYPPPTALVMLPLSAFEIELARKIWLLLSLGFLIHLIYLIRISANLTFVQSAVILLLAGFNLVNDLMLGQIYIFLLWLLMYGWSSYKKGDTRLAGLSWGILAALKFLPLFFLPLLIYKREFKMSIFLVLTFLFLHLLTFLISGSPTYRAFSTSFSENYFYSKVANETPVSYRYQSMDALVNTIITANAETPKTAISWKVFLAVWKLFWLTLFGFFIWKQKSDANFLEKSIAAVILLLLLLEAGSATYHLLFAGFAVMFCLKFTPQKLTSSILLLWILLGFLPTLLSKFPYTSLAFLYSRLWLLCLFTLQFYFLVLRQKNRESLPL